MFAWGQRRRSKFVLRLIISAAAAAGINLLFDCLIFLLIPTENTTWFYILKFLCGAVTSCAAVAVCFKVGIWETLYFGVIGYCVQHLSTRLFDIFQDFFLADVFWPWRFVISLVYYTAVYGVLWKAYISKRFNESTLAIHNKVQLILSVCVVGISMVYNTLGITYATGAIMFLQNNGANPIVGYQMLIFVYVMTALVALLAFALSVTSNSKFYYSKEKDMLDKLLGDRRARYEQDKLSVELLNMRLHDLKHYIGSLDEKSFKQQKEGIISYIEQYDNGYNTGNDALDTLFTNKAVLCRSKNIKFNAMIGGADFGNIPKFELYAVFCNAIDNAVEAVETLPQEKRVINIIAQPSDGGKTAVIIENYFSGELRMHGDMPLSDKKGDLHGVGVKSMKLLMEKYGGEIAIDSCDGIFSLKLIFSPAAKALALKARN